MSLKSGLHGKKILFLVLIPECTSLLDAKTLKIYKLLKVFVLHFYTK